MPVKQACIVDAFNVTWEERAIPCDRVETSSIMVDMYLPAASRRSYTATVLTEARFPGGPVHRDARGLAEWRNTGSIAVPCQALSDSRNSATVWM